MSGLSKSSSFKPAARNMARAPARLKPSVSARLRCLSGLSVTPEPPRNPQKTKKLQFQSRTKIRQMKKGPSPLLSDGPEPKQLALPDGHHTFSPTLIFNDGAHMHNPIAFKVQE